MKMIETHPMLGKINEWTHRGSEQNIWRGGDVFEGGNTWHFVTTLKDPQCQLDGWFSPEQLRAIADYIDAHSVKQ